MTDEGLREFQLNGKQLVFLFMAATVVAVVIFLCGVMVGRGVPARAGASADVSEQASLDPTAPPTTPSDQVARPIDTTGRDPVTAGLILTYPGLLSGEGGGADTLAPVSEAAAEVRDPTALSPVVEAPRPVAAAKPAVVAKPEVIPSPTRPATPAASPAPAPRTADAPRPSAPAPAGVAGNLAEPEGDGFVVQVAAVRQRTEANSIARRLSGKGYPAFVTTAGANFRVRVGKYRDRREAETVAKRLEQEERFEPWVTR
jgi:cell division septation protein DedD